MQESKRTNLSYSSFSIFFGVFLSFVIFISSVLAIDKWDEGYDVDNKTTEPVRVTSSQDCHIVDNDNDANDYFVPTKSQNEWNNLTSNLPNNVSVRSPSWTPARSSKCNGEPLTQTNECGQTYTTTGTNCCSHYSSGCFSNDVYWYDACNQREGMKEDCGAAGCIDGSCCVASSWSPALSSVCSGESFRQTSNCGTTRNAIGTKSCCVPNVGHRCSYIPNHVYYCKGTAICTNATQPGQETGCSNTDHTWSHQDLTGKTTYSSGHMFFHGPCRGSCSEWSSTWASCVYRVGTVQCDGTCRYY